MKIVLLGKNGMLGTNFLKQLSSIEGRHEIFAFSHSDLDILDFAKVSDMIEKIRPVFLINCTAYNDVIKAEDEGKELCYKINHEAIKHFSECLLKISGKLIHFSTDYVFDGKKGDFYLESDKANPLNQYGMSKYLGEKAILDSGVDSYIFRTAWLFGPNGRNFIDKMIELSKTNDFLKVTNDKFGSPTYTYDLAKFVLEKFIFTQNPLGFGIYHGVNEGVMSRYELCKAAFDILQIKTPIKEVSSSEFPSKVILPDYAPLKNSKAPALRSIKDALNAYLS